VAAAAAEEIKNMSYCIVLYHTGTMLDKEMLNIDFRWSISS